MIPGAARTAGCENHMWVLQRNVSWSLQCRRGELSETRRYARLYRALQ
jgi:hypothetical protein